MTVITWGDILFVKISSNVHVFLKLTMYAMCAADENVELLLSWHYSDTELTLAQN